GAVAHDSNPTVRRAGKTAGFTLVELLVVITIILILAGITLGALQAARQAARAAKTRATILKIHNIVMKKYQSYNTRRVPIIVPQGTAPTTAALARLWALRDVMRMEMPERASDIIAHANYQGANDPPLSGVPVSALSKAYQSIWSSATNADATNYPAECLYMIVMLSGPDVRSQFNDSEIGDTNNNGLPEFLDGWGNPIFFLRGAPGFTDADPQTTLTAYNNLISDLNSSTLSAADKQQAVQEDVATVQGFNVQIGLPLSVQLSLSPTAVAQARQAIAGQDHDTFDTRRVDPNAWRLVPLIWSAGPDGYYGLGLDNTSSPYVWNNDTYTQTWGSPIQENGGYTYADNIHNQQNMEVR
ncbi:MAG: type II secretion system protein, partial [Thermoguttaceae bacterium]